MSVGGVVWCRRVELMSVHITATTHTRLHPSTPWCGRVEAVREMVLDGVFGPLEDGGDVWCTRLEGWRRDEGM